MATHNTNSSPDAPVAVKITIAGIEEENRKFKLTLKDLGATVLPEKLRQILSIAPTKDAVFERYSDSSASFITLDSNNPSVYKQLYRAAKAKGKLRLKVTIMDRPGQKVESSENSATVSDHLPSRSYVHPYVSDSLLDQSPSSRISMEEDFKTLSAAPSTITLTPFTKSQIETKREDQPPPYQWPVSDNQGFSDATKATFAKTVPTTSKVNENKMERDGDLEAPLPHRFYAPQHDCLASLQKVQQQRLSRCMEALKQKEVPKPKDAPKLPLRSSFTLSCNQCEKNIADAHWHCGVCEGGDFDLCLACIQKGFVCDDERHWLIKRFFKNGRITVSTTETMGPRSYPKVIPGAFNDVKNETEQPERTCNACVQVFPESRFVNCTVCDDYDLCMVCHTANRHGHDPAHAFELAIGGTSLSMPARMLLNAGRNFQHSAICDGCDTNIYGVRHKCLNCPDWDFCAQCFQDASKTHPGHRFVPCYAAIPQQYTAAHTHAGICCDGPLCEGKGGYIQGDRYKCAVCNDTDFCARCEALPTLKHNRTHPLLKFKTPVRNVSVSTYGEKGNGETMRPMGDQMTKVTSKSTETAPPAPLTNAATQVQPLTEVKPAGSNAVGIQSPVKLGLHQVAIKHAALQAHFVRDTVEDGSVIVPNTQFTQTWTLKNIGPRPWPVGCSVCFVGGDSMLDVDPNHPSPTEHLQKVLSTNKIDRPVEKGQEIDFSVSMRTSDREGKYISYWRLKTADGTPFGHRLWCDVNVRQAAQPEVKAEEKPVTIKEEVWEEPEIKEEEQPKSSQMIFPTLEKESPVSSTHEAETTPAPVAAAATLAPAEQDLLEDVESLELDDNDGSSDDGFLTDEEYELIASGDEMEVAKNGKK